MNTYLTQNDQHYLCFSMSLLHSDIAGSMHQQHISELLSNHLPLLVNQIILMNVDTGLPLYDFWTIYKHIPTYSSDIRTVIPTTTNNE